MATKLCVVCGAGFYAPPSSKKITCSKVCSSKRKTETHTGKTFSWGAEARKTRAAHGQTTNLKKGNAAAAQSPVSGSFETNQEAKIWEVVSPEGDHYTMRNLRKWCKENPELFSPDDWELAYSGLRQIQASLIGARTTVRQWKGWTLADENRAPTHPMSRLCRECGKEFVHPNLRRRFCSKECKARRENRLAYQKAKRAKS